MHVAGKHYRSIWFDETTEAVKIIDQTLLPHEFKVLPINSLEAMVEAISSMRVRGAPLIGVAAAFGLYLALRDDCNKLSEANARLLATRPTAVNLNWALQYARELLAAAAPDLRAALALSIAKELADQDVKTCEAIGEHGSKLLQEMWENKQDQTSPLQILTHCNAGWLATVDWGTALAVIYKAQAIGVPLHVWVDETRPRNQGSFLTTWELQQQGVANTLIADNTGGYLMQRGMVDACLVGSDRTTVLGDVCNKIGTYLKALAAFDNQVPFYVALPVSTIDFSMRDGLAEIPIEERDAAEVLQMTGLDEGGQTRTIALSHPDSAARNFAFDVTPAKLVTALITEKGVCNADPDSILALK